jgi:hypothetical protein
MRSRLLSELAIIWQPSNSDHPRWTRLSSLTCCGGLSVENERAATLQRIIVTVQRRWGTRALRIFGQSTGEAIAVITTAFTDLDAALQIAGCIGTRRACTPGMMGLTIDNVRYGILKGRDLRHAAQT